jgi:hypothetical protein
MVVVARKDPGPEARRRIRPRMGEYREPHDSPDEPELRRQSQKPSGARLFVNRSLRISMSLDYA